MNKQRTGYGYGYGDSATWPPYYGHPNDPRSPDDVDESVIEPRPCPFCGDEGEIDEVDSNVFAVICNGCGTIGPRCDSEQEASDLWDKRIRPN